jgi:hypothetical protein
VDWVSHYVEGNTRASCDICGCARRFPDNLTYCADKRYRCERCVKGKTVLEWDQEIAAARQRREAPDPPIGITPAWENPKPFATIAAERRAALIPGWTPENTLVDTFDTVPGDWSTFGTVTEVESGVAQVSATGSWSAQYRGAWPSAAGVDNPGEGNFYMLSRFRLATTPNADTFMGVGVSAIVVGSPDGLPVTIGVDGPRNTTFFRISQQSSAVGVTTNVEIDDAWHYGELWWKGDGYTRAAIDFGNTYTFVSALPGIVGLYHEVFLNAPSSQAIQISDQVAYSS